MLTASKREGDLLRALRWALTGTDLFIVSINGRNAGLIQILDHFKPIYSTDNVIEAGYFTSKIFKDVEVLIDVETFEQPAEGEPANRSLASLVARITDLSNSSNGATNNNGNTEMTNALEEGKSENCNKTKQSSEEADTKNSTNANGANELDEGSNPSCAN